MVRSRWKQHYHNYNIIKKLDRKIRTNKTKFCLLSIRNKSTTLTKELLDKLFDSHLFLRIYTGKLYIIINLAHSLIKTKLGEYIFTKWRTRRIHADSTLSLNKNKNITKRRGKHLQKMHTKRRRSPVWSLRTRTEKIR